VVTPWGRLSTPGGLRLRAVAVVVPALVLGIVVASVVGSLSGGFDLLSRRVAPQVVASADLYVALSDMDAQVANVLLVGSDAGRCQPRCARTPASTASSATYSDSIDSGSSRDTPSTCSILASCW
jgi:hypothetical protein